jgi:hypothetical protein
MAIDKAIDPYSPERPKQVTLKEMVVDGKTIRAKDHVQRDEDGNVIGGDTPVNVNVAESTVIEIDFPTPLKADRIAAISTNGGSVEQAGILKANLYNSGTTILTIWFGEAIGAGKAVYLNPGQSWSGYVDNKANMYYDSDVAGGQLDYVLLG